MLHYIPYQVKPSAMVRNFTNGDIILQAARNSDMKSLLHTCVLVNFTLETKSFNFRSSIKGWAGLNPLGGRDSFSPPTCNPL